MPMTAQLIGFTAPLPGESVSILIVELDHRPSSEIVRSSDSFSRADTPLQSSFNLSPASELSPRSKSAWVSSLLTSSPTASTTRSKHPASAMFRPQVFSTSRRLTPPSALRACFISVPCPGFVSVQGVLSPRSYLPSSGRAPSMMVRTPSAHRLSPAATAVLANFEVLLHAEQRSHQCAG